MYRGQIGEASNREDLELILQAIDDDTNTPIDISTATAIDFRINDEQGNQLIVGALSSGEITRVDTGTMRVFIAQANMAKLEPNSYAVGMTITNAGVRRQLIAGTLAVTDGIVT